ncbi:diacylglycerol kinase [Aneurinibacillus sp. REN35]|uniref:diacylglycerol kinase n=1 Tax=Aneurinibacillus sp. REN35 TaxID=3237286 RepID=UPI0035277E0A
MRVKDEWRRLRRSFGYAICGIRDTVKTQRNMQIHVIVALLVLLLGWILAIPKGDVLLVFFSVFLVLILETVNTAIEHTVDVAIGDRFHPLAKKAKDAAAGGVLFAAILSVFVGIYVFGEPLWQFIQSGERRVIHIGERGEAVFLFVIALMFVLVAWLLFEWIRPNKKEED